jgi:hypothetical protein
LKNAARGVTCARSNRGEAMMLAVELEREARDAAAAAGAAAFYRID